MPIRHNSTHVGVLSWSNLKLNAHISDGTAVIPM